MILTPVAVTKDNIKDTVVKDGFWTAAQICTGAYAAACKAAGIHVAANGHRRAPGGAAARRGAEPATGKDET